MKLLAKSKLLNPYPPKGLSMKSHNMKGFFLFSEVFHMPDGVQGVPNIQHYE